jgi:vancomycin resistance protein YoaR
LVYEDAQINGLIQLLNSALGTPVTNADIVYSDVGFQVKPSADGVGVDRQPFMQHLDQAFLSTGKARMADVALTEIKPQIVDEAAVDLAERCNSAINEPVVLYYDDGSSLTISGQSIGSWIVTRVVINDKSAELVAAVSAAKMKDSLLEVLDNSYPGVTPENAYFYLSGGDVYIRPAKTGVGVDFPRLAADLEAVLFGISANRQLQLMVTTLQPEVTTADLEAMDVTGQISSFSTKYGWSSPERRNNVEVCANYVTMSLIAPHTVWSFNDTAGDATLERGYQVAKVISGNEYIDGIGGGVCQVATTVFDAVFDAGYPILSRGAHGQYQWQYPTGRDAAVFYPWLDFKWENDTDNWILLTVTCYNGEVTARLWGRSPGYAVRYETGSRLPGETYKTERVPNDQMFADEEKVTSQGQDGWVVNVTRWVYDAHGVLIRESTFRSVYGSVTEKIEYGTKPREPLSPPEIPVTPPIVSPPDQLGDNGDG